MGIAMGWKAVVRAEKYETYSIHTTRLSAERTTGLEERRKF